jgi:hypothetical protein
MTGALTLELGRRLLGSLKADAGYLQLATSGANVGLAKPLAELR